MKEQRDRLFMNSPLEGIKLSGLWIKPADGRIRFYEDKCDNFGN